MSLDDAEIVQRIHNDLIDSYDEELELELEDCAYENIPGMEFLDGAGEHNNEDLNSESNTNKAESQKEYRRTYFRGLFRLQAELVKLQDWVAATGHKVVIIFEGRDAAGKGGVIKRITQRLNPRICSVAALPAAGEIVLFNRSWYNRAGVERVMGFCDDEQHEELFRSVPDFERMLVRSGIQVIKYWISISDEEQHLRFLGRIHDPLKQWKLSPMDLESRRRWEQYTKAKEVMLERTHITEAPWWVIEAVDKKKARLNCIHYLLNQISYEEIKKPLIELPQREHHDDYVRQPVPKDLFVPDLY